MRFEKISEKEYNTIKEELSHLNLISYDEIKLPKRATKGSAGYDFFSTLDCILLPGESIKFPTGIKAIIDEDKFLMIVPRSGLGFKFRLQLDNTIGIIDSDYINSDNEGHIWIKLTNDSREDKTVYIKANTAIAQGIIINFYKVENDNVNEVRNGGFGSTSH